jgi:hypothetical protein
MKTGINQGVQMSETLTQKVLALQHDLPIEEVIRSHLERHRARRDMVEACCADLGIAVGTFYRWTRQLDITVRDYNHLEPVNG